MNQLSLIDATCKVEQAQAVLSLWLESVPADAPQELPRLIGSILTLLGNVPEAMAEADGELTYYAELDRMNTTMNTVGGGKA